VSDVKRITVVGAGAIGNSLAFHLAKAGHQVTVVARGERLAQVRRDGAIVTVQGARAAVDVGALASTPRWLLAAALWSRSALCSRRKRARGAVVSSRRDGATFLVFRLGSSRTEGFGGVGCNYTNAESVNDSNTIAAIRECPADFTRRCARIELDVAP